MDKKQSIISKTAVTAFYLAVIIEVMIVIIDKSVFTNPIEGRLFQITFLLCFVKVCLTKYSRKEYLVIFLFCILGAVSYFITERNEVIRLVMLIAACKNIDMQKCLKLIFGMTLAGCTLIILLSVTGICGEVTRTMDYGRGGIETRYTLGMGHPNALQCMVWALTTLGLYLYGKKLNLMGYLLVLAGNIFFYLLSDSKTSLLVILIVMFSAYLTNRMQKQWIQQAVAWVGMVLTTCSILISVLIAANAYRVYEYDWLINRSPVNTIWSVINRLLNGRIRILTETAYFEGTITTWSLFSRPENNYYFDMGWIRLFYWYGIIPGCIFVMVMLGIMVYCYRKKAYMEIVLITSFAIYSVVEAHAISVYMARNYVFFLIGMYWYRLLSKEKAQL